MKRSILVVALAVSCQVLTSLAADLEVTTPEWSYQPAVMTQTLRGRASVISGDALWFPQIGQRVKLAGIEACAVPQWAFDPKSGDQRSTLAPVPCGPLAKAWLKRVIGDRIVICKGAYFPDRSLQAVCSASGRDLGLEQLKVGWARATGERANKQYLQAERYARSARYGMWGTYVLDMAEWQDKAIDRTMERKPQADKNLLRGRRFEITPPFADWRNRPRRTDR